MVTTSSMSTSNSPLLINMLEIILLVLVAIVVIMFCCKKGKKDHFSPVTSKAIKDMETIVRKYAPKADGKDKWGNDVLLVDEVCMKICCQLALKAAANGNFGIGCCVYDRVGTLSSMLKDSFLMDDPQVGAGKIMYKDFLSQMLKSLDPAYLDPKHPHRGILDRIVGVGFNQLFTQGLLADPKPHVRSDRHGEMVTMDLLEDAIASVQSSEDKFQTKFPDGAVLYTQLESCPMCTGRLISSSIGEARYGAADNGGGMTSRSCGLPPVFIGLMNKQKYGPAKVSGNPAEPANPEHLIGLCNSSFLVNIGDVGAKQSNRACNMKDGKADCPNFQYCTPDRSPAVLGRAAFDLQGYIR